MMEVLQYLFARLKDKQPVTHEVAGQPYAVNEDGTLGEPVRALAPQFTKPTLRLLTVSGLVAAFNAGLDALPVKDVAFVVAGPTSVKVESMKADEFGQRHVYAQADHVENSGFAFGKLYDPEEFQVAFRAGFYFNEYAEKVIQLCSFLTAESSLSVADDGISQVVTVKQGGVSRSAVELPPEIPLVPWRTFREVNPVESKFLLRVKAAPGKLPQIAIFEIDGKWKLDTVAAIHKYITKELPSAVVIA